MTLCESFLLDCMEVDNYRVISLTPNIRDCNLSVININKHCMKYITVACLLIISFLSLINIASAEIRSDMAVLPAPINCFGGVTANGYIKCGWWRTVQNYGPGNSPIFNVSDLFYPFSANTVGPSFQGPTIGSCFSGDCLSGRSNSSLFETFLKVGVEIDHVIRVNYENDLDYSNDWYVQSFVVLDSGEVIPAVQKNNYFNNHYNNGYNNGFNNGYLAPFEFKSNGFNNGYNNNYNNGYNNGYIKPVE